MCRWMAWSGQKLLIDDLLFKPPHGLVDQSLHSRMGVETTNGDGFGLGWYGEHPEPGLYREVRPAWSDENLKHLESLFNVRIRTQGHDLVVEGASPDLVLPAGCSTGSEASPPAVSAPSTRCVYPSGGGGQTFPQCRSSCSSSSLSPAAA